VPSASVGAPSAPGEHRTAVLSIRIVRSEKNPASGGGLRRRSSHEKGSGRSTPAWLRDRVFAAARCLGEGFHFSNPSRRRTLPGLVRKEMQQNEIASLFVDA
jgi:hypothetical protein